MADLLYHYCSSEAFHSIVENGNVRLSALTLSNDAMEGRWLRQTMRHELVTRELPEAAIDKIDDIIANLPSWYITLGFSMSRDGGDRLSQWRGYADDGRGFAIGFDRLKLNELLAESTNAAFRLCDVNYGNEARSAIQEVADNFGAIHSSGRLDKITVGANGMLSTPAGDETSDQLRAFYGVSSWAAHHAFTVKNPAFEEEKEVRIIAPYSRASDLSFRPAGSKLVPFVALHFKPDTISRVVVGPQHESDGKLVKAFLLKHDYRCEVETSTASYRSAPRK
jgi:Protein of unknown function (DUF2971)